MRLSSRNYIPVVISVDRTDHHDADCFALIILSHGDEEGVYGTDGVISLDQLIEPIKGRRCRDLIGKPKLVFIQVTILDYLFHAVQYCVTLHSTTS